jgi:hypothetical protein
MTVDEPEPLDHDHPRAGGDAEPRAHAMVGQRRPRAEQARGHRLALGREVAGEAAELGDLVVDGRGRHERADAVAADDEVVALQELQGLPQRHQRHAELAGQPPLVGQRRAGCPLGGADALAKGIGDAVIPRQPSVHTTPLSVF